MLKSYLKQDNVCPPPTHNIILFKLDFNVKFPLLRLLQFLSDLKSTICYLFCASLHPAADSGFGYPATNSSPIPTHKDKI